MGWIRRHLPDVFLVSVSCAVALVVADTALFFSPIRSLVLAPHEPQGYMRFDSELGYDIAPNFPATRMRFSDGMFDVWSNSLGCFDMEFSGTQPYIYLTGDSFAWGWAPFEDKWGKRIESQLGIRVLTCGVDGFGTRQESIKAARQLAALPPPDAIVVGYLGANDADDDLLFPNHTVYRGYSVRSDAACSDATCTVPEIPITLHKDIKVWLATHSVLYTLLQRSVYAPALAFIRGKEIGRQAEQRLELPKTHTDAMLHLRALAESKHAKFLVVLIPSKDDVRGSGTYSNAPMKEFLEEQHISFVDLLPAFKENESLPVRPLYWEHDGHWNVEGNRVAGQTVSRYLRQYLGI
jgi:hypothetical protein